MNTSEQSGKSQELETPIEGYNLTVEQILRWMDTKEQYADFKASELDKRLEICRAALGEVIGKTKVVIDQTDLKIIVRQGVNVSADALILDQLADEELLTPADLACFSWKLQISENIHKLPKTSHVWKALTMKPAIPTLEVKKKD